MMKKLVFLGACALLMSSFTACTADSIPETTKEVADDTGGQTIPTPPPTKP